MHESGAIKAQVEFNPTTRRMLGQRIDGFLVSTYSQIARMLVVLPAVLKYVTQSNRVFDYRASSARANM